MTRVFLTARGGMAGQDWTARTTLGTQDWGANSLACAKDSEDIYAGVGGTTGTRYLHKSNNRGISWATNIATSRNYSVIACSANGKYLRVFSVGDATQSTSNFGASWTAGSSTANPQGAYASDDGKYLLFVLGSTYVNVISNFYGSAAGSNNIQLAPSGVVTRRVCMSSVGQYMYAVASGGSAYSGIYASSDYGINWSKKYGTSAQAFWHVACDDSGQHVVASDNAANGSLWVSSDYGATWNEMPDSNIGWRNVVMSGDGSRIAAAQSTSSGYIYRRDGFNAPLIRCDNSGARDWRGLAGNRDLSFLVASAASDYIYTSEV